jgi:hypothetical protein
MPSPPVEGCKKDGVVKEQNNKWSVETQTMEINEK